VFARTVLVLIGGALLAAPAAAAPAKTIPLGWKERIVVAGQPRMTFEVTSLEITAAGWKVRGAFRNRSSAPLALRNEFALLVASSRNAKTYGTLGARSFAPALPRRLSPGAGWRGTFSGKGAAALKPGKFVRVHFSYFTGRLVPGQPGFGWITDHAHRL
jgi:hypothetical protein